jgi:hypothetical protein
VNDKIAFDFVRLAAPIRRQPVRWLLFAGVMVSMFAFASGMLLGGREYRTTLAFTPSTGNSAEVIQLSVSPNQQDYVHLAEFNGLGQLNRALGFFDEDRIRQAQPEVLEEKTRLSTKLNTENLKIEIISGSLSANENAVDLLILNYIADEKYDYEQTLEGLILDHRNRETYLSEQNMDEASRVLIADNTFLYRDDFIYRAENLVAIDALLSIEPNFTDERFSIEVDKNGGVIEAGWLVKIILGFIFGTSSVLLGSIFYGLIDRRIYTEYDLLRISKKVRVIGALDLNGNSLDLVALGSGILSQENEMGKISVVWLHALGETCTDLAERLTDEFTMRGENIVAKAPNVLKGEVDFLRSINSTLSVVVVEWGKTRRSEVLSIISLLHVAGDRKVAVVINGGPDRARV